MKNITLFFFTVIMVGMFSCKNDDDNPIDCNVCPECEEVVGFKNYLVDFYSTHKDYVIQSVVFETVTEQALSKPAHLEGAIFETVYEQILVKESYLRHQILDSMLIHLVVNSETDSIGQVACYNFFQEPNLIELQVPAEYTTRTWEMLIQQGTGAEVPAEYETIIRTIVMTDSEIVATTEEQKYNQVEFRIPEDKTIREYLEAQFAQQSIVDCAEGNSYGIHD